MMQAHQVGSGDGEPGVRASLIIAELDFEDVGRQAFHDCANLTACEVVVGHITEQGYNAE
jgi:hypothetical protein